MDGPSEAVSSVDLERVQKISLIDADLLEFKAIYEARESFWAFRQFLNPRMKKGWWQRQVALELQQFWNDYTAGLRPILVMEAPPQHGKSVQVIDFIAWICGQNPDLMTIFTSFSKRLGLRANLRLQRIFDSPAYRKIFPETYLTFTKAKKARYVRNSEMLEFVNHTGSFRNTTVNGSITGETLNFGVIDDPLKGRDAANSETIRDKTWDWFTDDFLTRFDDLAALLFILTRWHVDDPVGRLIIQYPNVKVLKYPAIAESGIPRAPGDLRKDGEALFPEHKSIEFLMKRKEILASTSWMSLYQQMPIVIGGNIIKGMWFKRYTVLPKILWRIITADTAQKTKEHNDFSVFQCWGMGDDSKIYLLDQIRGKWESPELKRRAIAFWSKHKAAQNMGTLRKMFVEDKASGTGLIQDLKHGDAGAGAIPIKGIERNVDKLTKVMDVLSYIETGYVSIPLEEPWCSDFVDECEAFTADDSHPHDDQIDPMCDAVVNMLQTKAKGFFYVT